MIEGDDAVVALSGLTACSGRMDLSDPAQAPDSADELPDDLLTVEIVYPDGSTATTADQVLAMAAGDEFGEPALNPYMGTGGQES